MKRTVNLPIEKAAFNINTSRRILACRSSWISWDFKRLTRLSSNFSFSPSFISTLYSELEVKKICRLVLETSVTFFMLKKQYESVYDNDFPFHYLTFCLDDYNATISAIFGIIQFDMRGAHTHTHTHTLPVYSFISSHVYVCTYLISAKSRFNFKFSSSRTFKEHDNQSIKTAQ